MKRVMIFAILGIGFIFSSCKSGKEKQVTLTTDFPEKEVQIQENKTHCYLFSNGKDSIRMTYQIHENEVEGWLNYDFFEKDGSIGEIEGEISGDTLKLEFEFLAEGTISEQQVYFLKKEDKLFRGSGEMYMDNDSVMVYRTPSQLSFDDPSPLIILSECPESFINKAYREFYLKESGKH